MTTLDFWYPTAFSGWGDEERDAMQRVIASDRFTMGDETAAFEQELASFNKRKHAIAVNSGSSANLIAVAALEDRRRAAGTMISDDDFDRTACVPALAWATTYAPLVQHGYKLDLNDCDDTWCTAPGIVVAGATPVMSHVNCDLMVSCSILGNPSAELVYDLADLNDDCEAFGAHINGKPTGAYGTIATQSFFWSHQLGAIEGGACLTDNDDLALIMRQLRDHGMDRTTRTARVPFSKEYNFLCFGYNVRPVEMHMAIARVQLTKAAMHRTARRRNWNTFIKAAAHHELPIKIPTLGDGGNPFGLHFEVASFATRSSLAAALRNANIDCRLPTGGSFRMHPYGQPWRDQQTPRADKIHDCGLFVGNAPYDISDKIETLALVMREVLAC